MAVAAQVPRPRMGEPVRFRLERSMRAGLLAHAKALSAAAGRRLGLSAAIRDLLSRALAEVGPGSGYASGFREGFLAGWADSKAVVVPANGHRVGGGRSEEADLSAERGPIVPLAGR